MKISYNWLKSHIDLESSPEEVADALTLVGLEVEEIHTFGSLLEGVIVGDVRSTRPHPNADRLRVCDVHLGTETVQIVCGAPNVETGQRVPVATIGTVFPPTKPGEEPFVIRKAKLRGESSSGMICSEVELGLGADQDGIMVLGDDAPVGTPLSEYLSLETDTLFEIGLTPNRPDAACHIGVARDLSALLKRPLKLPEIEEGPIEGDLSDRVEIQIEDPDRCGRYAGLVIDNVTVGPSPTWLSRRLESIGLRSINNVVDVTNFVLHEMGQPLHAFDLDKIRGSNVIIRTLQKETPLTTLDHQERTLPPGTLAICDAEGPMAIAGIMGGLESEVTEETTSIFLESAWFEPTGIRRSAKELTLQTDASYRYERGVDPEMARRAAFRAAHLIAETTGGTVAPALTDLYPAPPERVEVTLRPHRSTEILGVELDTSLIREILHALGIESNPMDSGSLMCIVPTFRPDIEREIDLIEEVGRIYDYNRIPAPEYTPRHTPGPIHPWEQLHQSAREAARRLAYHEISTNSLLSREESDRFCEATKQIHTLNPVSQVATTLRTTLTAGFLQVLTYNRNRNCRSLRLFEVGHTYQYGEPSEWIPGIREESELLLGLSGEKVAESWRSESIRWSVFDLKSDLHSLLEQLGMDPLALQTRTDGPDRLIYLHGEEEIARLERLPAEILDAYDMDDEVFVARIRLSAVHHNGLYQGVESFTAIPRFPAIDYDIAFVVPDTVHAGEMEREIRSVVGDQLLRLRVFDLYQGEGLGESKKSIAFRLTFLDSTKTLTIKDVEPLVKEFTKRLEKNFGAILRS